MTTETRRMSLCRWAVLMATGMATLLHAGAPASDRTVATEEVKGVVEPFDLRDVKLLDSPFKQAQEVTRARLMDLPFERLVHPFRWAAGIPVLKDEPSVGRFPYDGHVAGHFLSACAQLYRNTGDLEIKHKADQVVACLAECQAKSGDGYIGGFKENFIRPYFKPNPREDPDWIKVSNPWYTLHKIYAGLLDMYLMTGNEQAFDVLRKAADWVDRTMARIPPERMDNILFEEHGGICEVLVNIYAVTGEQRYLKLAQRFTHQRNLAPLAEGIDPLDRLHANTEIPKLTGAVRQYRFTAATNLLDAATFFWNVVSMERSFVTGGISSRRHLINEIFPPKQWMSRNINGFTCESCCSYAMLRLGRELFALNPQSGYFDYDERSLYNQVLSTVHPETGMQIYFQFMESGHVKGEPTSWTGWRYAMCQKPGDDQRLNLGTEASCCPATGLENNSKHAGSIYYRSGDKDLYVNLFIPSVLEWKQVGLTLRQETRYPQEGSTRLLLTCAKPMELALRIRRPSWATQKFQLRVNGEPVAMTVENGYARILRHWKSGDCVDVAMPMSLRLEGFRDKPERVAVLYGPLVMVGITEQGNSFSMIEDKGPAVSAADSASGYFNAENPDTEGEDQAGRILKSLTPVAGRNLEFHAAPDVFRRSPLQAKETPVVFRPLYSLLSEPYAVYWDIVNQSQFQQMREALTAELNRQKELEPRTTDMVLCMINDVKVSPPPRGGLYTFQTELLRNPGWMPRTREQVNEKAHALKVTGKEIHPVPNVIFSGMFFNYSGDFRTLQPGSSLSYRLKLAKRKAAQQLRVRLWKTDVVSKDVPYFPKGQGKLEIVVDDRQLATCDVGSLPPGQFHDEVCSLPADLILGKTDVEVILRVPGDSEGVHGIYECRIVTQ